MSDINLLPEDLKKKQAKTLATKDNFDLDEIEFTEGEKLKSYKEIGIKKTGSSKLKKSFKPKFNDKSRFNVIPEKKIDNKEYQQVTGKKEFVLQKNNEQKKSEKIKSKNDVLDNPPETNIDNQKSNKKVLKIDKTNKNGNFFKNLLSKFQIKFKKKKDQKDQKDKDLDVNLLPFGSNIPTTKRMIFVLAIAFVLSFFLIFIVFFGYYIHKEKIIKDYNSLESELNVDMENTEKYDNLIHEINFWQEKVKKIEDLLDKHIYWTKFFEKLEENTLPNVQFTGFTGSINNSITLQATAPDYQTVSKQWIHLQNADDFVKEVIIGGTSMSVSGEDTFISFSLTLDFVDDIFYKE